ncbi:MAG TPA: 3-isopropylmalate dehydratase small subunit [Terriglobales bacterium]|nr:3-isopropylmalate dehydratase small subunit [Terriglobales bacterium]
MEAFRTHTGLAVPLDRDDVDTDQIIPKQFLKRIERSGYGDFLFYDWRYSADKPRPDFVLNAPRYQGASILIAGRNFGCGSSREHAAWALADYGIRVVIASTFADIFRNNAGKNGLLAVVLKPEEVAEITKRAQTGEGYRLTVSLEDMTVKDDAGFQAIFNIEAFTRYCLLEGLDDIGLTMRHQSQIEAYEKARQGKSWLPAVR